MSGGDGACGVVGNIPLQNSFSNDTTTGGDRGEPSGDDKAVKIQVIGEDLAGEGSETRRNGFRDSFKSIDEDCSVILQQNDQESAFNAAVQ